MVLSSQKTLHTLFHHLEELTLRRGLGDGAKKEAISEPNSVCSYNPLHAAATTSSLCRGEGKGGQNCGAEHSMSS